MPLNGGRGRGAEVLWNEVSIQVKGGKNLLSGDVLALKAGCVMFNYGAPSFSLCRNIPAGSTSEEVKKLFQQYGDVKNCYLVGKKDANGFGNFPSQFFIFLK